MPEVTPQMAALIERTRAQGLWFWAESLRNWRCPDQFEAEFRQGLTKGLIWGVASPATVIEALRKAVDLGRRELQHAEAELARAIRAARSTDA